MTLTKDLQAISKELKKMAKQTEKLAVALGKAKKPQAKHTNRGKSQELKKGFMSV